MKQHHISEILMHLGEDRENYYNAVCPPIIQSSNFAFPDLASFRQAFTNEAENHIYTRGNNPTVAILRKKLAALEKADDALVFASGSGAIAATVLANVKAGDHVICIRNPYSWTNRLMTDFLNRFGVAHTFVDGRDMEEIKAAKQDNTTLLYLESPSSLVFDLQDLSACAIWAKANNITTCIDNSHCSPIFQNPIELGIDLVIHSGSKYLNGHSDVVCGVVCGSKEMISKIFHNEYMTLGAIISPSDAALIIRGLRTLDLRLKRHDESALFIAKKLDAHPKIKQVLHTSLSSFSQNKLANQQMRGNGGLFSFHLNTDSFEKAEAFFHRLKHFLLAVSWGGHESLVMPTVAFYNIPGMPDSPIPFTMVRIFIGLEDAEWLWEDIEQALEVV